MSKRLTLSAMEIDLVQAILKGEAFLLSLSLCQATSGPRSIIQVLLKKIIIMEEFYKNLKVILHRKTHDLGDEWGCVVWDGKN